MSGLQKELLTFAETFPIQQIPGFFNIMTLHSTYITMNQKTMQLVGYRSTEQLAFTRYEDLPCKAAESADIFKEEDQKVITSKLPLRILSYQCVADNNWMILLGEKAPIFNIHNEVIGTTSQFLDITHLNLIDLGRFIPKLIQKQFSYILLPSTNLLSLSQRQTECLFFIIRGYSSQSIAKILGLSFRTVHDHIDELKLKFQCSNKMMLIEKAINEGFINILPETLLKVPFEKAS